jgi:diguanylate cyclase (GGDEF)-like protein
MEPNPRRILLIDDDELHFRLTQANLRHFRGERFGLDWEPSYAGGLDRLLSGAYAACFLDYELGEGDGLELLREAVARGCRTPIVFLTADDSTKVDIEAMHAGAMDFLVKGELTPSALERSLRYALKLSETLERLRQLATRDDLTDLYNRREFERLREAAERDARERGGALGLVMVDIDQLKEVNDRYGHAGGDALLAEVARRLRQAVGGRGEIGRLGGDEFAVLLPGVPRAEILAAAEALRAAVGTEPVRFEGTAFSVTASVGCASLPDDGTSGRPLLAVADEALYRAKQGGRNRVEGGRVRGGP